MKLLWIEIRNTLFLSLLNMFSCTVWRWYTLRRSLLSDLNLLVAVSNGMWAEKLLQQIHPVLNWGAGGRQTQVDHIVAVKWLCVCIVCGHNTTVHLCAVLIVAALLNESLFGFDSLLTDNQAKGVSIPGINNPSLSSYIVDRSKHLMRRVSGWSQPSHVHCMFMHEFSCT